MTNEQNKQTAHIGHINLINSHSRVNTAVGNSQKLIENTGKLSRKPACEVRLSFAEKPNEEAIADALRMLINIGSRG